MKSARSSVFLALSMAIGADACATQSDQNGSSGEESTKARAFDLTGRASPAIPAAGRPAALSAPSPFIDLTVPDHASAVVSLPLGATSPRPVLVATQGYFDKPEWQCQMWRGIVQNKGFVVCPRGLKHPGSQPEDDRYYYSTNRALERELKASLAALRDRFPDYAAEGPVIYTGFSRGAIMGVPIVSRNPSLFRAAVLIEGGYDRWTAAAARAFAKGGGERVLFACGKPSCQRAAAQSSETLERFGASARVVYGEGGGHSYFGAVEREARKSFSWISESDARWRGSANAVEASARLDDPEE